MLFYLKKHAALELLVALTLGGLGYWGIASSGLSVEFELSPRALFLAALGAAAITAWTLLVQLGYGVARGREFALDLTASLAKHFASASPTQMLGALAAAAGEEVLFRGFIHGRWGIWAGAIAFMLAHIGKKDIRTIGYWSIFHGLGFGLIYELSGNLAVPMLAHGLFDLGAMAFFQWSADRESHRCAS